MLKLWLQIKEVKGDQLSRVAYLNKVREGISFLINCVSTFKVKLQTMPYYQNIWFDLSYKIKQNAHCTVQCVTTLFLKPKDGT